MNKADYLLIDAYEIPDDVDEWLSCPKCNMKPLVWVFNNGRSTGCGCGESMYNHFSIHAESINSIYKRTGKTAEYSCDDLKNNWNQWVKTGEVLFEHASKRNDERW